MHSVLTWMHNNIRVINIREIDIREINIREIDVSVISIRVIIIRVINRIMREVSTMYISPSSDHSPSPLPSPFISRPHITAIHP